ncbi:hypothetical protein Cadr_000026442 [Camelus dromedarius]|uniref:Uncharacterized protein n=1 Tax=Camelus dromedarius TaxID=9838 RepID=A0A5N4CFG1_CAMDR|nr:hypothetical protein Cadr_000026442 [Camelus dromedarius]
MQVAWQEQWDLVLVLWWVEPCPKVCLELFVAQEVC